ncbi:MAG: thioredoxin family protein [Pseudomonadota bacterium]
MKTIVRHAALTGALAAGLALLTPAAGADGWIGDDGLHKQPWMRDTFLDMSEDLAEAAAEGKRLVVFFEQRGCIYCTQMHEEVFSDPVVAQYIADNFFVVQLNLYGDREATDLDGEARPEKELARKWGVLFTPTMLFLPEAADAGSSVAQAAVAVMPGAFGRGTTLDLFTWVAEKRYARIEETGEDFQRYHARRIAERDDGTFD